MKKLLTYKPFKQKLVMEKCLKEINEKKRGKLYARKELVPIVLKSREADIAEKDFVTHVK